MWRHCGDWSRCMLHVCSFYHRNTQLYRRSKAFCWPILINKRAMHLLSKSVRLSSVVRLWSMSRSRGQAINLRRSHWVDNTWDVIPRKSKSDSPFLDSTVASQLFIAVTIILIFYISRRPCTRQWRWTSATISCLIAPTDRWILKRLNDIIRTGCLIEIYVDSFQL